jgi:hypothetical protein
MRTSDISISSSIVNEKHITNIDFTNITTAEVNDYFELHLDNEVVKMNIVSEMTIERFVEWVAMNCNANFDFYSKALATNNTNVLNITTRSSDSINIDLDYHKE